MRLATLLCFGLICALAIPAQSQQTSVTLGTQDIEIVDADWMFYNDADNPRIVLIPKPDQETAKAKITQGTQVTYYSGEEIHYALEGEAFLLEKSARIERDDFIMDGPEKIEYLPEQNTLVVIGTKETPASLEFFTETGVPFVSKALRFDLQFEEVDGKRRFVSGRSFETQMARKENRNYKPKRPLMRKLSPPRP